VKARGREKIKVFGNPVAELKRQACATVEHEVRWHGIQLRPKAPLGFGQDVETSLKGCRHVRTSYTGFSESPCLSAAWTPPESAVRSESHSRSDQKGNDGYSRGDLRCQIVGSREVIGSTRWHGVHLATILYRLTRLAQADLFAPEPVWISTQIAGITGAQSQAVEQELATLDSSGNPDRIGGEAVGSDHEREPREAELLKTFTLRRQNPQHGSRVGSRSSWSITDSLGAGQVNATLFCARHYVSGARRREAAIRVKTEFGLHESTFREAQPTVPVPL
jgi:hypothetical protein